MLKYEVDILASQETNINGNCTETTTFYIWFFSGDDNKKGKYTEAGVAIVITNKFKKRMEEISPTNDRLMSITIGANPQIAIISNYSYTATAESEDKSEHIINDQRVGLHHGILAQEFKQS